MTSITYELCPECEKEVQLKAALSIQVCPNCGKHIIACSMCEDMNCSSCELIKLKDKRYKRYGRVKKRMQKRITNN
jgi:predicted RNA-binding Zn-ribbon protein involved in translation (DUF1610 family)